LDTVNRQYVIMISATNDATIDQLRALEITYTDDGGNYLSPP